MGTTLNKLEYVNTTKEQMKTALNQFGAGITDETTFRDYVDKINDIYDNWEKATGEGTNLTLNNTKKAKLNFEDDKVGYGNIYQETGENMPSPDYPSEVKVVKGKNLFDKDSATLGKSFDGNNGNVINNDNLAISDYISVISNKTYCVSNFSSSTFYLIIIEYNASKEIINIITNTTSQTSNTHTMNSNTKYIRFNMAKASVNTVQLEIGSTATSYLPYNTINNKVGNKNLFELKLTNNGTNIVQGNCTASISGDELILVASGSDMYWGNIRNTGTAYTDDRGIKIYRNGNTKISYKLSNSELTRTVICAYDKNNISLGFADQYPYQGTYTFPDNCEFVTFRFGKGNAVSGTTYRTTIMVAYGDEIPTTYQAHQEQNYPITINAPLYSEDDYYYRDNGEWYVHNEWNKVALKSTLGWIQAPSSVAEGTTRFYCNKDDVANTGSVQAKDVLSNSFVALRWNDIFITDTTTKNAISNYSQADTPAHRIVLRIENTYASSLSELNTFLDNNNFYAIYKLETPTNTKITDETLIEQLENWYNAQSYNDQTNINSDGDLPMIINVGALKKGGN